MQLYEHDDSPVDTIARFAIAGLVAGEPVVLIATTNHLDAVHQRTAEMGLDVTAAVNDGRLLTLGARATLASFLLDDVPDGERFRAVMDGVIARSGAAGNGRRVRVYAEMVELLWRDGNAAAAIRLEQLCNELASRHPVSLLWASSLAAGVGELQHRPAALETELAHRRRMERSRPQSREELLDFVENAPVALRCVGADGRIIWANQAELDLVGRSRDEYVGRHISEFHVDSEVSRDVLERLGRGETLRDWPARLRRKDGSIRHVLIDSSVLWRDGEFVHTRCFTRDVTAEVEARVEQATRERFRELFIGMLGHDLRNPLGAIATGAEVLAMRGARGDAERLDHASATIVARIGRSAARMARMIDQVLDFASLNVGTGIPLDPRPINLADVCAAVIDELHGQHPGRTIEVQYVGSSWGCWDFDRLSQVFSNLIGNALAYGDPSQPIRIVIRQAEADVVVRVHNMGPPIPPEIMPTLFDPFRRAHRKQTGDRGLGLGLYITKEIVVGHGGTIDVRSTAEKGTVFDVRLPRLQEGGQRALPARPEWPEVAAHAMPSARVLVVEDDVDSAEVLRELLVGLGHDVRVARDGSLALVEAQRFEPDVVLLDLGLPTMDGVEVARRLRAITARARIVAVTGCGPAAASGVEFDAYLVKPAGLAALIGAMTPLR